MKQLKLLSLMLAILMIPIMVSCGGDDEKGDGSSGDDLIIIAAGTWMCTQSVDTQNGKSYQQIHFDLDKSINHLVEILMN